MNILLISCFCLLGIVILVSASPAPKSDKVKNLKSAVRASALNDERKKKIHNSPKRKYHFRRVKPQSLKDHVPILKSLNQPHGYRRVKNSKDKGYNKIKKLQKSDKRRKNSHVYRKRNSKFISSRRSMKAPQSSGKLITRRLGKKHTKQRGHKSQISGLKKFRPKKKYQGWTPKKTKPQQKRREINRNEKMKPNEKTKLSDQIPKVDKIQQDQHNLQTGQAQKTIEQQKTILSPKKRGGRYKKKELSQKRKDSNRPVTEKPSTSSGTSKRPPFRKTTRHDEQERRQQEEQNRTEIEERKWPERYEFVYKLGGEPLVNEVMYYFGPDADECYLKFLLFIDDDPKC